MDSRYILVLAVIVVMGWFAVGVIYNLRRGDALLRWLREGLPRVGQRTTFRWLGSSVVEMVIEKARKPFRRLETLVVLAPRDVPWIWLLARINGRRDTLIFRAQLTAPPWAELELADPTSWTGKAALKQASEKGWQSQDHQGLQLMAPPGRLEQANDLLAALDSPARQLSGRYWRFHLSRAHPHMELHMPFPSHRQLDAGEWFEILCRLAQAVSEQR